MNPPPTPTLSPERPRVPIDPRIRRRRIEVRRDEGRRRLRLLLVAAGLTTAAALVWLATRSPLLDVDRIEVTGARQTGAAAVVRAARIARGAQMTDVAPEAAAGRVEALPWVATARVSRRWPSTVRIEVRERRAVAVSRARGGGWLRLDRSGRFLERVAEPPEDLVAIEGAPPGAGPGAALGERARGALAVAAAVPPERVGVVRVVALLPDGSLELRLAGTPAAPGPTVRFGAATQVDEKLVALFTVLDRVDTRGVEVLDVRVPSNPVIVARRP